MATLRRLRQPLPRLTRTPRSASRGARIAANTRSNSMIRRNPAVILCGQDALLSEPFQSASHLPSLLRRRAAAPRQNSRAARTAALPPSSLIVAPIFVVLILATAQVRDHLHRQRLSRDRGGRRRAQVLTNQTTSMTVAQFQSAAVPEHAGAVHLQQHHGRPAAGDVGDLDHHRCADLQRQRHAREQLALYAAHAGADRRAAGPLPVAGDRRCRSASNSPISATAPI